MTKQELIDKIVKGEDVWGYNFVVANSKNGARKRHLRPTKMHIEKTSWGGIILIPYSKKGKLLYSKKVNWNDVKTSETELEAIDAYNALISKRIDELDEQKKELEELKIL